MRLELLCTAAFRGQPPTAKRCFAFPIYINYIINILIQNNLELPVEFCINTNCLFINTAQKIITTPFIRYYFNYIIF